MDPPEQLQQVPYTECSHAIVEDQPWHEDGNVILQTENTRFKVHRSVLSSRSPIFKDLFALGTTDENADPCPVVHLPDRLQDVRHFLKAIYDRSYFTSQGKTLPSFELVAASLRLGKKYEVEDLVGDATIQLGFRAPIFLDDFDLIRDEQNPQNPFYGTNEEPNRDWIHADYAEAVILADEMNLEHLLPSLLLSLCINDPDIPEKTENVKRHSEFVKNNLEGWVRRDGTRVILPTKFTSRLLTGYYKLAQSWYNVSLSADVLGLDNCETKFKCRRVEHVLFYVTSRNPLPARVLRKQEKSDQEICSQLCKICKPFSARIVQFARLQLWEELPDMFDFPRSEVTYFP